MALVVTPGFLRAEGPGFKPDRDLKKFVQTTHIAGLSAEEFGTELNFTYSQTDAPATLLRDPGTLWFRRGEGHLYMWDTAWHGVAELSIDTQYSGQGMWVSVSDRKEFINRNRSFAAFTTERDIRNGAMLASGDTGSRGHPRQDVSHTGRSGDIRSALFGGLSDGFDASYVTISAGATAYKYERLVDVGYGQIFALPGQQAPGAGCFDSTAWTGVVFSSAPYASTRQYFAHVTESVASTAIGTRYRAFIFTEARRFDVS